MKAKNIRTVIFRFFQGMIIGGGAIIPGVSGGVLCAAFGLYMPLMKLLAHPKKELPKQWRLWLNVGLGWIFGFAVFAIAVMYLLKVSENMAMSLFAGLIFGTLPALIRQAHELPESHGANGALTEAQSGTDEKSVRNEESAQGRNGKKVKKPMVSKYITLVTAFILSAALFVFLMTRSGDGTLKLRPGIMSFALCGVILGLSFVIPGLTSSSFLMLLGLYEPMTLGAASLDFSVLIPIAVGFIAIVIALSRLMTFIFGKFYTQAYFAVIGVVLASTAAMIPRSFTSAADMVLCFLVLAVGICVSYVADKRFGK